MFRSINSILYTMFCVAAAMIGYQRHHSIFWAIIDFIFAPLAWAKWLILHQVNLTLIEKTFEFLMK